MGKIRKAFTDSFRWMCALLTFFSPEWVDILVLDAATIYAIITFKRKSQTS